MRKPMRFGLILLSVAAVSFFLFIEPAHSQDSARVVFAKGAPKIMKAGTLEWSDCKPETAIDNGDRIRTLADEAVEIFFLQNNRNIIRVDESSDIVIKNGSPPYFIELSSGSLLSLVRKLPADSKFEVRTPVATCGVRGTGWRSRTDGTRATFETFEKTVYIKGIDESGKEMEGELLVESGWKVDIEKFERPSRIEKLLNNDFERWGEWKKEKATMWHSDTHLAEGEAEKRYPEGTVKT